MPAKIPRNVVITCMRVDVEAHLDAYREQYDLDAAVAYQVGSGNGSFVEVMLIFRFKEERKRNG